jgi:hypothetical protein
MEDELALMEIAYHLQIPLYKLVKEMPYEELLSWFLYFEKRPVGWRDDLRVHYLIKMQNSSAKTLEMFPALNAIMNPTAGTAASSLKHSAVYQKMLSAIGGDKVDFL